MGVEFAGHAYLSKDLKRLGNKLMWQCSRVRGQCLAMTGHVRCALGGIQKPLGNGAEGQEGNSPQFS